MDVLDCEDFEVWEDELGPEEELQQHEQQHEQQLAMGSRAPLGDVSQLFHSTQYREVLDAYEIVQQLTSPSKSSQLNSLRSPTRSSQGPSRFSGPHDPFYPGPSTSGAAVSNWPSRHSQNDPQRSYSGPLASKPHPVTRPALKPSTSGSIGLPPSYPATVASRGGQNLPNPSARPSTNIMPDSSTQEPPLKRTSEPSMQQQRQQQHLTGHYGIDAAARDSMLSREAASLMLGAAPGSAGRKAKRGLFECDSLAALPR